MNDTILDEHLAYLDGQMGPGWIRRLEFVVYENRNVAPGTVIVDPTRLTITVPSAAEFRATLDWHELDLEVRATFNRVLRQLADRAGVTTPGIARSRSKRRSSTSDHAVGLAMDVAR